MIKLSDEQQKVHDDIMTWINEAFSYRTRKNFITLSGLAGTGKTTLLGFLSESIHKEHSCKIAYVTYTGKASVVLKQKLKSLRGEDYVGTIHSLIYKPIIDKHGQIEGWSLADFVDFDLIFIDEASMVNSDIWEDLTSYGIPIIAIGDHGQLPPISLGVEAFNLMSAPELVLKEIHRQAKENPIIKLSMIARREGYIDERIYGKTVAKLNWRNPKAKLAIKKFTIAHDSIILCGMNKTRAKLNNVVRKNNEWKRIDPLPSERIICLKNNKDTNIMNGQIGTVHSNVFHTDHASEIFVEMDGLDYRVRSIAYRKGFGKVKYGDLFKECNEAVSKDFCKSQGANSCDIFDYGYAISVHKSQGSEWDRVILIDERNFYQSDEDYSRWLYTGITRAKNRLLMIEDFR